MKIIGIGVYIVENNRFKKLIKKKKFINRICSFKEINILKKKNNKINEIPISLPYRIFGSSKMKLSDIISSFFYLISISIKKF